MNLEKEAQAVKSLWDKADRLEAEVDRKTAEASDARWQAAERSYNVTETGVRISKTKWAEMTGIQPRAVSRMVKVWAWWLERQTGHGARNATQPTWGSAVEITINPGIEGRAAKAGKSPAALGRYERNAVLATRDPEGAAQVIKDPRSREQLTAAIAKAEVEEAVTRSRRAGVADPEIPAESKGFGLRKRVEAGTLIGQATRAISMFIKLVRDNGPVPDEVKEEFLEELTDHQERVAWAIEAVSNGTTDWDAALAKLAEG